MALDGDDGFTLIPPSKRMAALLRPRVAEIIDCFLVSAATDRAVDH
jgi:hypothetical protein